MENRPRTHSVPFSELSEKFLNGDEQPREQEDSLSDDLDTGVQFTSTVYFINSNELDSERKPSSPLGSSEIEVDLLQEIISGSKKRILPKQAIPSPFRIQKNSPSATQEVVEEKHPTIAPKKPLETQ